MTDPVPLPRQSRRLACFVAAAAMTSATIVALAAVGWWPRDGVLVAAFTFLMVLLFGALFAGWFAMRRRLWAFLGDPTYTPEDR